MKITPATPLRSSELHVQPSKPVETGLTWQKRVKPDLFFHASSCSCGVQTVKFCCTYGCILNIDRVRCEGTWQMFSAARAGCSHGCSFCSIEISSNYLNSLRLVELRNLALIFFSPSCFQGNKPWVSLPRGKGIRLTIAEERDKRLAAKQASS